MVLIQNKKAHMNYEILKTFEAGLELLGIEVKSLRAGRASLGGSRVMVRGGEAYLVGATIEPWQPSNTPSAYDPERSRRLLLNKKEIAELSVAEDQKGLTVVPTLVYNKGQKLKVEVAIARGKKKHDKRQDIKRRDVERDIQRKLK
jgi:SsrA-binding protein